MEILDFHFDRGSQNSQTFKNLSWISIFSYAPKSKALKIAGHFPKTCKDCYCSHGTPSWNESVGKVLTSSSSSARPSAAFSAMRRLRAGRPSSSSDSSAISSSLNLTDVLKLVPSFCHAQPCCESKGVFFFNTTDIPCVKFGASYLGKGTAAAWAVLPISISVCSFSLRPNYGMAAKIWDFQYAYKR